MATFRLSCPPGRTGAGVSARLGVAASRVSEAGAEASRRSPRVSERALWVLASAEEPQDGVELAESLQAVLTHLEPVATLLWELARDGYEADWICFVGSHACEHAVELDRDLLARLLTLPGQLLLDVYADDDDDDESGHARARYA